MRTTSALAVLGGRDQAGRDAIDLPGLAQRRRRAGPGTATSTGAIEAYRAGGPAGARGGQGGDRHAPRLAHQGGRRSQGGPPLLRQGSRRRAAHLGDDDPHRGDGHRVAVRAVFGRGRRSSSTPSARQAGRRGGRVLAALDGDAAPRQPAAPVLQHVRAVPGRPDRRALVRVGCTSSCSTWRAPRRARSAASCSAGMSRRSGHRARSSGCSACC